MAIERIAIMGAGSLGTILGAYISRAGRDVTLIDAYREHVDALNKNGARVIGKALFTAPVKAITPDELTGTFDLFFYMVKQLSNDIAIPQMIKHCHDKTIICCCQNGLPEMAVAKHWPQDKVFGAPVGWGATYISPGVSELTTVESATSVHLGSLDGTLPPSIFEVQKVLECMCTTILTENLISDRWTKLTVNSMFSGMSTVIGGTFGDVIYDDTGIRCCAVIGSECYRVAKAAGVTLGTIMGADYNACCSFTDAEGMKACQEILREKNYVHKDLVASMLQDIRKGKKCEIRYINGVVSEIGDEYGIRTPANDLLVQIVTDIENGKRIPCMENMKDFLPII